MGADTRCLNSGAVNRSISPCTATTLPAKTARPSLSNTSRRSASISIRPRFDPGSPRAPLRFLAAAPCGRWGAAGWSPGVAALPLAPPPGRLNGGGPVPPDFFGRARAPTGVVPAAIPVVVIFAGANRRARLGAVLRAGEDS